ncbi:hypothetical protein D3C84_789260 [compost metagenome]
MGNIGGKRRQSLERIIEPAEHGVERVGQFRELGGHLVFRQALGQGAGGDAGGDFAHAPQWPQPAARGPGAEQCSGQRAEAHRQPDQVLHALQEVLMVSDVEQQCQLCGVGPFRLQRRAVDPVVRARALHGMEAGQGGQVGGQVRAAVEP